MPAVKAATSPGMPRARRTGRNQTPYIDSTSDGGRTKPISILRHGVPTQAYGVRRSEVGEAGPASGWATRRCEEFSMPFALIPTALGVCFCLVWVFIGGMILRDGHIAAEQERATEMGILPWPAQHTTPRSPTAVARPHQPRRHQPVRAAS
jgi:hypothetical protein